ncbi:MAG: FIST N-terminal domain-containing protein [Nannocystaceae bacterium]
MELALIRHELKSGWSREGFPDLDSSSTLVIVFGAPSYHDDAAAIEALVSAYPRSTVIGCSTSGEIFGTKIYDESLAIAVVRFAHTRVAAASRVISRAADSEAAGRALAESLAADDLRGVFVLSDGLGVNGTELVRGLSSALPAGVAVTGGLAGDGSNFTRTWVLHEGRPQSGIISAVGLYGDRIRIGHGSKGGWDPFGPRRQVTRSVGNVLYELDGRPALQLYKEYLGDRAEGLPATGLLFPLALSDDDGERQIVRTILAVDEAENSLTFAGDIPTGARAQLMKANFDRLIEGAEEAGANARGRLRLDKESAVGDILALAISCVGRRLVLASRTEEEIEATRDVLPPGCGQVGFYSYGEISPYASGPCELHNQTMTLTTLCEV